MRHQTIGGGRAALAGARTLLATAGEDSAEHGWVLVMQAVPSTLWDS